MNKQGRNIDLKLVMHAINNHSLYCSVCMAAEIPLFRLEERKESRLRDYKSSHEPKWRIKNLRVRHAPKCLRIMGDIKASTMPFPP